MLAAEKSDRDEVIISRTTMKVMPFGDLADLYLDEKVNPTTRTNAEIMLQYRLREYNGAMWSGAPLQEQASVIRAIRKMNEHRKWPKS